MNGSHEVSPGTILLVEDEPLLRTSLADFLRDNGYRVVEAQTTSEAEFHLDREVDLILSDVDLRGEEDGCVFARRCLGMHPDLHIVLMSGTHSTAERVAREMPRAVFLAKPFRFQELLGHIVRLLGGEGSNR